MKLIPGFKYMRLWIIALIFIQLMAAGCISQLKNDEIFLDGESLTQAWVYDTGAPINLTPVYASEIVITVPSGGPMLALEISSGDLRWEYNPPEEIWERGYTANDHSVYVGLSGGKLVALNTADGEMRWEQQLGINVQTPPLIVDDMLYVSTTFVGPGLESDPHGKAKVFALNSSDGSERWAYESDNYILQKSFISEDKLYVGGSYYDPSQEVDEGGPMRIYALDTKDASPIWIYESLDGYIKAIYATKQEATYIAYQDFVNGLDAETGKLIWRKDTGNWVPSLSGWENTIYFGSANTVVHALSTDDGDPVWRFNIPEGTFNYVLGAPVRIADELYFLTQQGDIMALNAETGTLLWSLPTGITSRVGLAVSGGWAIISDQDGRVYAYTNQ